MRLEALIKMTQPRAGKSYAENKPVKKNSFKSSSQILVEKAFTTSASNLN